MSVCACLTPPIPEEIRKWGEENLKEDNPYRIIGDQLFSFMEEEELTSMYSITGRPSVNPVILSLVTIFQYKEKVPDRMAAEWVKTRLDWKYALHLDLFDTGFHYSDLCNFRKRLLKHGKESLIFEQLLQKIEELGFLEKRNYQRTDSTHILTVARKLWRLENLCEGLRVALKAIQKADKTFYETKLPDVYTLTWSKQVNDYKMTDEQRKELLQQVGKDIHWLLTFLETNKASFLRLSEVEVLQKLFSQNFTLQASNVLLKEKVEDGKQKIQTPHDPDARYSEKRDKKWVGYKVHISDMSKTYN